MSRPFCSKTWHLQLHFSRQSSTFSPLPMHVPSLSVPILTLVNSRPFLSLPLLLPQSLLLPHLYLLHLLLIHHHPFFLLLYLSQHLPHLLQLPPDSAYLLWTFCKHYQSLVKLVIPSNLQQLRPTSPLHPALCLLAILSLSPYLCQPSTLQPQAQSLLLSLPPQAKSP